MVKCVGFDSPADIAGGETSNSGIVAGDVNPTIDTTVKASGAGSMKLTIPSNSDANSSGAYFTNFSKDLSVQFDGGSEFYVQWRQRFSPQMLAAKYAGAGGFKLAIIGSGDQPGGVVYYSCTDLETVVTTYHYENFPEMYNSCSGSKSHGAYNDFFEHLGQYDFKLQNARTGLGCLYSQDSTGYFPPNGNCFGYVANEWMTFQVHVKVGPRVGDEFVGSTIELSMAREGKPSEPVISYGPYNLTAGPPAKKQKFGKVWLTNYNTGKTSGTAYPEAYTWYDDLIISRQKIADPQ